MGSRSALSQSWRSLSGVSCAELALPNASFFPCICLLIAPAPNLALLLGCFHSKPLMSLLLVKVLAPSTSSPLFHGLGIRLLLGLLTTSLALFLCRSCSDGGNMSSD